MQLYASIATSDPAETTIAPYSLRGRDRSTVSTPITWGEVESCTHVSRLTFTADDVLDRVQQHGDLLARLEDTGAPLAVR